METKTATVTKVIHNKRSYEGKFGKMYVHEVRFDNGDYGDYNSKSETCEKFTENLPAAYTIETRQNGQYTNIFIKPVQEDQKPGGFGGKKASGSDESFALSYAKDLGVAKIEKGIACTTDTILAEADRFYGWLQSKKQKA